MKKRQTQVVTKSPRKAEYKRLPWEYCECGCKCHTVTIGSHSYSLFNDLKGGFHLSDRHDGARNAFENFTSFDEADRRVRKRAESELKRNREQIQSDEKILAN